MAQNATATTRRAGHSRLPSVRATSLNRRLAFASKGRLNWTVSRADVKRRRRSKALGARSTSRPCRATGGGRFGDRRLMSVPSPTVERNLLAEPRCLGDDLDPDVHRGRDRDRLIERSTALVVLDEVDRLRLVWAGETEPDLDPLEDRGVRPMPDPFDGGLDTVQPHAGVARPPLHQQNPAR